MPLLLFSFSWVVILYLFNAILAKRFQVANPYTLFVYICTLIAIGLFGEVFAGNLYNNLIGTPLWEYRVFPIHNAYTSYYSIVIWGMYGFYLYFFHDNLHRFNIRRSRYLALILAVEALVLEVLINVTHIILFNEYIFYYFPSDLWHLTSIQALPFYLIAGLLIAKVTKFGVRKPTISIIVSLAIVLSVLLIS